jgi:hypothetical protein
MVNAECRFKKLRGYLEHLVILQSAFGIPHSVFNSSKLKYRTSMTWPPNFKGNIILTLTIEYGHEDTKKGKHEKKVKKFSVFVINYLLLKERFIFKWLCCDPAATQNPLPLVENGCLAGRDGVHGPGETNLGSSTGQRRDVRFCLLVPVADPGGGGYGMVGRLALDPVDVRDPTLPGGQVCFKADDQAVSLMIESNDIISRRARYVDSPALSHREVVKALMAPHDVPFSVYNGARFARKSRGL